MTLLLSARLINRENASDDPVLLQLHIVDNPPQHLSQALRRVLLGLATPPDLGQVECIVQVP